MFSVVELLFRDLFTCSKGEVYRHCVPADKVLPNRMNGFERFRNQ